MSLQTLPEELDSLRAPAYGPYELVRGLLRPDTRLLDVGCGNAKVSAYLAGTGATVDGIEPSASRAAVAAQRVRYLSTVPAGEPDPGLLPEYDIITFFDVLEHLHDPARVLDWSITRLAPSGRVVASIPNSAHISFRRKMLAGDWSMADWGLFDRTHLRFYDPESMLTLTPIGTNVESRHYFSPDAARGWRRARVEWMPKLFAVHVVLIWRRSPFASDAIDDQPNQPSASGPASVTRL